MSTGPFVMRTPFMSTYTQQLWIIGQMQTDNRDNEKFDKAFQINVALEGVTKDHKPVTLISNSDIHNRTRHLICERNYCDEFTIMHLGFLEYAHYIITVRFYDLNGFHQRYHIKDLKFFVSVSENRLIYYYYSISFNFVRSLYIPQFKTYNPDFTQIEIWFRFIFLLFSFIVTVSSGSFDFIVPFMAWCNKEKSLI